jgi:hypothetical protein
MALFTNAEYFSDSVRYRTRGAASNRPLQGQQTTEAHRIDAPRIEIMFEARLKRSARGARLQA